MRIRPHFQTVVIVVITAVVVAAVPAAAHVTESWWHLRDKHVKPFTDKRYFRKATLRTADAAVNESGDPVDWTNLKGMPAAFADGVDDTGGTASDLDCAGCVETSDLAPDAVTGAKILDGEVVVADLAFDPATQGELDALGTPGTINTAGNPVDWTKLKGVPAAFADGVDDTSGTASDLVCSGCVETSDLAPDAVTSAKIADEPAVGSGPNTSGTVTTTLATAGSITVSFPSDGFALISSEATFEPTSLAPPGQINASIVEDSTTVQSWTWDSGDDDGNVDSHQSFSGVTSVTSGSHTYDLRLQTVGAVSTADYANLRLVVMFFPTSL